MIKSQAPKRALKPKRILAPPKNAIIPDNGTKNCGIGTPAEAAYCMVPEEKWVTIVGKKIKVNRNRPIGTKNFI